MKWFRGFMSASMTLKSQQYKPVDWPAVTEALASVLWRAVDADPCVFDSPHARVVLKTGGRVSLAANPRLDPWFRCGGVGSVVLRDDPTALQRWLVELHADATPVFQRIATHEYARTLVQRLRASVQSADRPPQRADKTDGGGGRQ